MSTSNGSENLSESSSSISPDIGLYTEDTGGGEGLTRLAVKSVGNFTGWEGRAVLTLENGQRWQIANGGTYMTPALPSPNVKIVPANLGGFWMAIEGVANRVKVLPLGGR